MPCDDLQRSLENGHHIITGHRLVAAGQQDSRISDTDTPAGKFMLTVFAALSQLEREQLKQRQRESIEIAKAQGKYTGRKPIEIDWTRFGQLYGEWKSKSITGRDFMRRTGLSANTFYRRVREYEAEHGTVEPTFA